MPDRPVVEVAEYGIAKLARSDLTDHDLVVLSGISDGLVRCTATVGGWELRAGAVCGVIELDRCRVAVRPKLMPDGATVVSWIGYAMAAPVTVDNFRGWTVRQGGLRDVIAAALVDECTALMRGGLHRDYRRRAAVDTVLRGRLDLSRQVSRRFGQVDRLFLHRFDRETNVWENVVCRVALEAASRVADSPELRRSARDLAARFPAGDADPAVARRWLATGRYHRMNARYRPSHLWAGLLLGAGGVSDMLAAGPGTQAAC
jgi:5-methylcytosine-specific restriction enzyme subunit McrC